MKFERRSVKLVCNDSSRTKQAFKDECDVNKIMKKFKKVMGVDYLTQYNGYAGGQFGDFSQVTDYRTALEQVRIAEDIFMQLPAMVRKQFDNDTAQFLDYCQDSNNLGQLEEWGLVEKQQPIPNAEAPKATEASNENSK